MFKSTVFTMPFGKKKKVQEIPQFTTVIPSEVSVSPPVKHVTPPPPVKYVTPPPQVKHITPPPSVYQPALPSIPSEYEGPQLSRGKRFLIYLESFLQWVVQIIMLTYVIIVVYMSKGGATLFTWHPTLMTVAVMGLMFEAVIIFEKKLSPFSRYSLMERIKAHWLLQASAMSLMTLAFTAVFVSKHRDNKEHFHSWHSAFGLTTIILLLFNASGGIAMMLDFKMLPRKTIRTYHSLNGSMAVFLACITVILGLNQYFTEQHHESVLLYLYLPITLYMSMVIFIFCKVAYDNIINPNLILSRRQEVPVSVVADF